MTVQIDRYEISYEQSPRIIIFDNKLQTNICSVNTLNKEHNLDLAGILLDELNTGKYEEESS